MSDEKYWSEWPRCAGCTRPRQTVCPTCGQAGNRFPLAEYQAIAAPQHGTRGADRDASAGDPAQEVLLLCPRCDEAFHPRFYRVCPECGTSAGDGIELAERSTEHLSSRVLLAIYALIAVAALLLLYFWSLFRNH